MKFCAWMKKSSSILVPRPTFPASKFGATKCHCFAWRLKNVNLLCLLQTYNGPPTRANPLYGGNRKPFGIESGVRYSTTNPLEPMMSEPKHVLDFVNCCIAIDVAMFQRHHLEIQDTVVLLRALYQRASYHDMMSTEPLSCH